ncbi:hypothetical protein PMIN01_09432 [Paraphaeosphaeria minitans]|uniref:Uncharacterized protein n=1 Tax=Paraphaeosphaeria minitans TaxID=565426 RepID=A0A9P6GE82_9PLEO|nr:hypothetical protein PMIN01_09432 [Paraphaeosphaeria minitans]
MSSTTPNASGATAAPASTTTTTTTTSNTPAEDARRLAEFSREIRRQDDLQRVRRAEIAGDHVADRAHAVARGGSRDSLMFHWLSDRVAELMGEALDIVNAEAEERRPAAPPLVPGRWPGCRRRRHRLRRPPAPHAPPVGTWVQRTGERSRRRPTRP